MNPESEEKQDDTTPAAPATADVESSETLTFNPSVASQRYFRIQDLLREDKWSKTIKKVVDFGCSNFRFFKHLKALSNIEHIYGVDIDESLMAQCQYQAKPLWWDCLVGNLLKLTVDLFVGSIAEPDSRLVGVDAVICIELIEHLDPETLEKVPYTVFECMRPKLAVFTTPNADFNVMFNLKRFRHWDHKFEWTRREFEDWCHALLRKYDNYEVYFEGIGAGPQGTEHLGCVSQMAVFTRREDLESDLKHEKVEATPYKLFSRIKYPEDKRSDEQKLFDRITHLINKVTTTNFLQERYASYDGYEIPIDYLLEELENFFNDEQALKKKLLEMSYKIVPNADGVDVVKLIDEYDSSESDVSEDISENDDYASLKDIPRCDYVEEDWS